MVLVSDLLLLLSENNQKYTFAAQDNKVGLLVWIKYVCLSLAVLNQAISILQNIHHEVIVRSI